MGRRFQDIDDIQKKKSDDGIERYSKTGVPEIFPAVAESSVKSHSCSQ
jgi:hypothetical protein